MNYDEAQKKVHARPPGDTAPKPPNPLGPLFALENFLRLCLTET